MLNMRYRDKISYADKNTGARSNNTTYRRIQKTKINNNLYKKDVPKHIATNSAVEDARSKSAEVSKA